MPELPNPHQLRYLERVGAMRDVPKLTKRSDTGVRPCLASAETSASEALVSTRRSPAAPSPATTTIIASASGGVLGRILRWCGFGFALGCVLGCLHQAMKITGVLAFVVASTFLLGANAVQADEIVSGFDSPRERFHYPTARSFPDLDIPGDPFWESDEFFRPQSQPTQHRLRAGYPSLEPSPRYPASSTQRDTANRRSSSLSIVDQIEVWYWLFVVLVFVVGTWAVSSFLTSQELQNDERRRLRMVGQIWNPAPATVGNAKPDSQGHISRFAQQAYATPNLTIATGYVPPEASPDQAPSLASARQTRLSTEWKSCVRSIKGNCRSENQDRGACLKLGKTEVLMVCDGCGGIPRGGDASTIAINAAERAFRSTITNKPADIGGAVRQAFLAAEAALLAEARALGYSDAPDAIKALQTTMIIVVTHGKQVDVAWLGDGLVLLVDQVRGNQNLLTPHRPDGHTTRLSSCLGPAIKGAPSSIHTTRSANSLIIVSTDGISDRIDSDGLAHSLISLATQLEGNMEAAIESLLNDCANHKSGSIYDFDDNMTLGVLCGESRPALTSRRVTPTPMPVEPERNVQDRPVDENIGLSVDAAAYAAEPIDAAIHRVEPADPAIVTAVEATARKTWLPAVISPPIPTSTMNSCRHESALMADPYLRMDKAT